MARKEILDNIWKVSTIGYPADECSVYKLPLTGKEWDLATFLEELGEEKLRVVMWFQRN